VIFTLKNKKCISSSKSNTTNPKWFESFILLVENPDSDELICQVEDQKSEKVISVLKVPIISVLNENGMTIDQEYNLSSLQSDYDSKINIKFSLKVSKFFFNNTRIKNENFFRNWFSDF
jgi:Ca2+-dependent lipid-binding protein